MTRINLVPVEDLADQHLFAEWREIKMIPVKLRKLHSTKPTHVIADSIPAKYTMSTGHVRFFYNKMLFLYQRYIKLSDELRTRDYSIAEHDPTELFLAGIVPEMQDPMWEPSKEEIAISVERISTRLNEKPDWYRYYGDVKSPKFFTDLYKRQL